MASGSSTESTVFDGGFRWLDDTVDAGGSTATVVDGTVYIGTVAGLVAYDTTGERQWAYEDTDTFRNSAPCVVDGVCYAKDNAGSVYALEASAGELRWEIDETFPGWSSPTVYEDRCVVCGDESLAAIDTFTGEIEWTSEEILGPVNAGITIHGDRCYVSGGGGVTAHDLETGERRWSFDDAGYPEIKHLTSVLSGVVVHDDTVYVGSGHGSVYAIQAATGTKEWSYAAAEAVMLSAPTFADDRLVFVGYMPQPHRLYGPKTELIILDVMEGTFEEHTAHVFDHISSTMAAPTVVGDLILWTGNRPEAIIAFSMEQGTVERLDVRLTNKSDPTVVDGVAYIGSPIGVLAIDLTVDGSSSGLRVAQGSTGHHHAWAETASLEIDGLTGELAESTLAPGEETTLSVKVTFSNGRDENILERMTAESVDPDIATVGADGTVRAVAAGGTEIVIAYRDETDRVDLTVDGGIPTPGPGIVGTAVGIGGGTYLLERRKARTTD